MKTTLVILAIASLALVGCGKKDKKSSNRYTNFISDDVLIEIPQQSGMANQTVPVVLWGGLRLQVSQFSSTEARLAIQQMYYNQGGYRLRDQDASIRRFVAVIQGSCNQNGQIPGQYNQFPGQNNQFPGQYNQYPGQYNQFPGQYNQSAQCQMYSNNPTAYQQCLQQYGQNGVGYGCTNGSQLVIQSIRPN